MPKYFSIVKREFSKTEELIYKQVDRKTTKTFDCDLCSSHIVSLRELKRYKIQFNSGYSVQTSKKKRIKMHIEDKQIFECDKCQEKFAREIGLKRHIHSSHQQSVKTITTKNYNTSLQLKKNRSQKNTNEEDNHKEIEIVVNVVDQNEDI